MTSSQHVYEIRPRKDKRQRGAATAQAAEATFRGNNLRHVSSHSG